jgi:hypothetical protein
MEKPAERRFRGDNRPAQEVIRRKLIEIVA